MASLLPFSMVLPLVVLRRRLARFGLWVAIMLLAGWLIFAAESNRVLADECRALASPASVGTQFHYAPTASARWFNDFAAMAREIVQRQPLAVIIGEIHTDADDQANALALLKALAPLARIDALVLEWVDDVNVETVRSFLRGELSAAALADALKSNWSWGVEGYLPLLEWAREARVQVRRSHYRVARRTLLLERRIAWDLYIYRRDEARKGHMLVYILGEKHLATLERELSPELGARVIMIQQYEGNGAPEFARISNADVVCAAGAAGYVAPDGILRLALPPTFPDGRNRPGEYGIFTLR